MKIRLTEPKDAPRLPAIEQSAGEAFDVVAALAHINAAENMSVGRHLQLIAGGAHWVTVDSADTPVAFLAAEVIGQTLHLCEFSVRLEHQKRGLGRAMLATAFSWARLRQLSDVTLTTFRDIRWNEVFYRQQGFRRLDAEQINSRLAAILRQEALAGLPADQRCAMRLPLSS